MKAILAAAALAVTAGILAASAAAAPHQTRHVSTRGTDAGDCARQPCRTIGYAVGQANPGDRVEVDHGTYAESVSVTKQLSLEGHDATIDATGELNGLTITGPDAAGTSVRGFTVSGAYQEGIFADLTSDLTIEHNRVINNDLGLGDPNYCQNQQDDCGEAIHLQSVLDSRVSHNLVRDNVGGILLTDEEGPTAQNELDHNDVLHNTLDCGITLASHWFQFGEPAPPDVAGVYENHVDHNVSSGNGAAGIGVFAGPPGAAAWGNVIDHNVATDNGLPGVAIHSHFGFQNVEDNVVTHNFVARNGADPDAETGANTGIIVFADLVFHDPPGFPPADPIQHETVAHNQIADEHFGIYLKGAAAPEGLGSNHYHRVDVPVYGP